MERFLQINSEVGIIVLSWNSADLISRIEILPAGLSGRGLASGRVTGRMPPSIMNIAGRLLRYLENGLPLQIGDLSLVDSSQFSAFQKSVYEAALKIPHGETRTYSWIAMRTGSPLAMRAVGQALKKNPIPILIPCHRVVSMKNIGGFMGMTDPSGREVELKRKLIGIENDYLNPYFPFMEGFIATSAA